jgi:hypothetical protein
MISVPINIQIHNARHVQGKLHNLLRSIDRGTRDALDEYYREDFKPMLRKILTGFKGRGVPAQNAPNWAAIKLRAYGIGHSLGVITGDLLDGAMSVEPSIFTFSNMHRTKLLASFDDVPRSGFPYMPIIQEGLDGLHKAYPVVEAARSMTHKNLVQRVEDNVSQAWYRATTTGG